MGLTGAAADDIEAELMRKVCETEVGGAAGMLACFEPLIVAVVTNPSNYPCPALQASAALALAKFMLIRCEEGIANGLSVVSQWALHGGSLLVPT